jgi:hypothetical protein
MAAECDIRLDSRDDFWIVTVTCMGRSETYSRRFPATKLGVLEAAEDGLHAAIMASNAPVTITARGNGAYVVAAECHKRGYACVVRKNHPNR